MVEEMRQIGEYTLGNSEKAIAILGDRWWPQTAKQEEGTIKQKIYVCNTWKKNVMSAQVLSLIHI